MVKIGITVFPGSNCDKDIYHIFNNILHVKAEYIWYKNKLKDYDSIIIPGGFTYGDRLRAGAIAAHSQLMDRIKEKADSGVPILGICNGFQILVESGLLPGALMINKTLNFICSWVDVMVVNNKTPFTSMFKENQKISIPIAHGEGKYMVDEQTLLTLNKNHQITLKYEGENPNGSIENIASVCNTKGNVMGMMPHPERASDIDLVPAGVSSDAVLIFKSLINYIR